MGWGYKRRYPTKNPKPWMPWPSRAGAVVRVGKARREAGTRVHVRTAVWGTQTPAGPAVGTLPKARGEQNAGCGRRLYPQL